MACIVAPVALLADPAPQLAPTGRITLFQSDNRVLVMVRIGDGELLPMVFDTGSDGNSFDNLLVTRNRLRKIGQTIEVDGSTGRRRTLSTYSIPQVSIGGLPIGHIEGAGLDYDRSDAMGILSPDVFRGRLVSLELGKGRADVIAITTPAVLAGDATAYRGNLPAVDVTMPDGSKTFANFDTGFDGPISLPLAMMKTVPLIAPPAIVGRFKTVNADEPLYGARVRGDIAVGPLVLKNPDVTFIGEAMNIGLPLIRRLKIVLDPAKKRNWVSCSVGTEASCSPLDSALAVSGEPSR